MDDPDVDYLQPGFDPKSVTIPRLRSIMITHNVPYPSTAKKADLVNLFNQEIAPKAQRLLEKRARVKRMSSGIVNAGDVIKPEEDEDLLLRPPSRSRRSASPRKSVSPRKSSSRIKSESVETEHAPELSTTRTVRSNRRSASRGFSLDPDPEPTPTARRTRKSMTPQVVVQNPSQESEHQEDDIPDPLPDENHEESVFTDDNPFQSGSPPRSKTPGGSRRKSAGPTKRKSAGPASERTSPVSGITLSSIMAQQEQQHYQEPPRMHTPASEVKSPPELRRASDVRRFPMTVPLAQRGLSPSPAPRRSPSPGPFPEYQHEIDAGEEFTPEEQQELEEDRAVTGEPVAIPHRAPAPPRSFDFTTPIYVLLLTMIITYGIWYRQEKIAVGYCGLGREATQLLPPDIPVPEWAVPFVEPQCELCPPHAYCYENNVVRCEPDFIIKPHPLSFGGLIPIPPICEPDGEKVVRVKAITDRIVDELRNRRAEHECGGITNEQGEKESPAIREQALKEIISRQRRKKLTQQEFDDFWDAAIGEVKTRDEIVVSTPNSYTGDISDTYLSSTSLARLPLTCAIKRAVIKGLERHRFGIGAVILGIFFSLYVRRRYRSHIAASAKVPALVDLVLDRLSTQKETCDEEYDDPWLFLPNLRDDVLRSIHSLPERERIWARVIRVVEQNANVRTAQRESRSGEVGRAWEWTGPVSGDMAARRKGGRTSYGGDTYIKKESTNPQWEEGKRPIY